MNNDFENDINQEEDINKLKDLNILLGSIIIQFMLDFDVKIEEEIVLPVYCGPAKYGLSITHFITNISGETIVKAKLSKENMH